MTIYITPSLSSLPPPPNPSRPSRSTQLRSSCPAAACHQLFYTWKYTHGNPTLPVHSQTPHLMFTAPFSMSPLYSCPAICNIFLDYIIWCRNCTAEHIPWENHNSERHRHPNIHWSTISNSQDVEAPTYPSPDALVKRMWSIYTMDYYSAVKRNKTESFEEMWMVMGLF